MSKIISLLMALFTALFNNFEFYVQPDYTDTGKPGYEIVDDDIDYQELYSWYVTSLSSTGDACNLNPKNYGGYANHEGYYWFIAGAPYNPEAKAGLMEGDIIVAPQDCTVKNTPGDGTNSIVVENKRRGTKHFKIIVEKPKAWFCCAEKTTNAEGVYIHTNEDHRVDLKAGQVIAVASPDTTIRFFRGDTSGDLKEVTDLKLFYNHTNDDVVMGSKDDYWNGRAELNTYAQPDIQESDIYTRSAMSSLWKKDSTGWWYGNSGIAGIDWVQSKWIVYENEYYYFNDEGYMVTGWYENKFFRPQASGTHKEGTLAYNAIVPFGDGYYYVNYKGEIEEGKSGENRTDDSNIYIWDDSDRIYRLSTTPTANSVGSVHDNNNPSQNIPKYEVLNNQEYESAVNGELDKSDGWYLHNNKFCFIQDNSLLGVSTGSGEGYEWNDYELYEINGAYYYLSSEGYCYMPGAKIVTDGESSYCVRDDGSVLSTGWYDLGNENWVYADEFTLLCDGLEEVGGDMYYFKSNCVLDNTTPVVEDEWKLVSKESGKRTNN